MFYRLLCQHFYSQKNASNCDKHWNSFRRFHNSDSSSESEPSLPGWVVRQSFYSFCLDSLHCPLLLFSGLYCIDSAEYKHWTQVSVLLWSLHSNRFGYWRNTYVCINQLDRNFRRLLSLFLKSSQIYYEFNRIYILPNVCQ